MLYAIDPGTEKSAVVRIAPDGVSGFVEHNAQVLTYLKWHVSGAAHLVIEQVQSYGMAVGREVFETVFWSGRFAQTWQQKQDGTGAGYTWSMLPRKDVKLALCGSMKAKDANIRQALIDRYGGSGCTKKGGPLYGIKSHLWAALALAVAYQEQTK
jgi:hypothetical protein